MRFSGFLIGCLFLAQTALCQTGIYVPQMNSSFLPPPANLTHYHLYSAVGTEVQAHVLPDGSIDLSTSPAGVYFLTIHHAEGRASHLSLVKTD